MGNKQKVVGYNYLHTHVSMETALNVPDDHVVVDRKEYEEVIDYFRRNPKATLELGKGSEEVTCLSPGSRIHEEEDRIKCKDCSYNEPNK